jgi:hypothetical protein
LCPVCPECGCASDANFSSDAKSRDRDVVDSDGGEVTGTMITTIDGHAYAQPGNGD